LGNERRKKKSGNHLAGKKNEKKMNIEREKFDGHRGSARSEASMD
jgi:hypothetical protein